jgi:MoaA/NifB/PqqE/SkfB family radical SAM enzyme
MDFSAASESQPLTGLHLLLSYECNFECDHCFVWGGPEQNGTMSAQTIENILQQAHQAGTVEWIYFEGGEPFLFYPLLCFGVQLAHELGFRIGVHLRESLKIFRSATTATMAARTIRDQR